MRYPDGHNEEVRQRIIEAASRALRTDGIDSVSIPKLMKLVGMTHGSFYIHFKDRDDLVAAAIAHAGVDSALVGDMPRDAAFGRYLSKGHVEHPELGCVIAALGVEGARQKGKIREAFTIATKRLITGVETKLHPKRSAPKPSDEALEAAARMVGAVVLARLVQDEELVERLLDVAKRPSR